MKCVNCDSESCLKRIYEDEEFKLNNGNILHFINVPKYYCPDCNFKSFRNVIIERIGETLIKKYDHIQTSNNTHYWEDIKMHLVLHYYKKRLNLRNEKLKYYKYKT